MKEYSGLPNIYVRHSPAIHTRPLSATGPLHSDQQSMNTNILLSLIRMHDNHYYLYRFGMDRAITKPHLGHHLWLYDKTTMVSPVKHSPSSPDLTLDH